MSENRRLDCVVIGYNETPFEQYEGLIAKYGVESEAYRDLKFSFVDLDGRKLNYIDLLNQVFETARADGGEPADAAPFKSCEIPNLAAAYLTHFLRRRGYEARYVNLFQHEKEELRRMLDADPLCVAITTTFYLMNFPVSEMVNFIRAHNPRVKIVVGGPLVANHARNYRGEELATALDDIGADLYVVESQGEATLLEIVRRLREGLSLDGVPNTIRAEGGALRGAAPAPENNSLDENYIDWRTFSGESLGPTLQTRTARSCAFSCSFCNYPTRAGKLTLTDLGHVEAELDSMLALGGVRNVVFIDDTFNVPLPRFKDICRLMIRKKYPFKWFSYFRCGNSDEEAIELMARSGCTGVFLGIESGSQSILKNMNKAVTVERYVKGVETLHRYGITTFDSFIIGFPGETAQTVDETIAFIKETRPDYYRAQLWYCEPGTPVENQRERYGIKGEGFVWSHDTMDSLEAMDHIDRLFLTVEGSTWLPQWSFDFWTIPYLLGRGVTSEQFKELMRWAHKMLALEIAYVPEREKRAMQREYLRRMVVAAGSRELSRA
jgi:radical SAM PhpK family P-methyltransferase